MAHINRGNIVSALRPGINTFWGLGYDRYKDEYAQIYEAASSNMNYERDVNMYGLGNAVVKPEGTAVQYDAMAEGWSYDYIHIAYGLAFSISYEAQKDNLYMKVAEKGTKSLGKSMKETKEIVAANIFNRAFSNSYTFGDGVELCSTSCKLSGGGTFSNKAAVDMDLSENALEQALIDIGGYVNDRSQKVNLQGKKIIVPRQLEFEVQRILKSNQRVATADNDINVLKEGSYLPGGHMVYHYLTDSDAWFVLTNAMDGFKHFIADAPRISVDEEFNTDNILVKAYERYSFGCTDKRAVWGSAGA